MTIHTPAQLAAIAVTRAKWRKGKGRRKKIDAAPITRSHSNGMFGPMIKVLDDNTRSLIDDAMRKRIQATGGTDGTS